MEKIQKQGNGHLIAIITMMFLFAMISFVTNMAAPFGNIWGNKYEWSGMMGNMMNFAAYLFMGIPAGKMLTTVGYKKTALIALGVGVIGLLIQYLSSITGADVTVFSYGSEVEELIDGKVTSVPTTIHVTLNLFIYLLGAFVCGFCVCMLNTVVNPMLNLLGGGGNKGNQLIQTGGALNSLSGTLTPFLVGALIGTVTRHTSMSDVAPLLFIGMAIFIIAFIIISFVTIPEPALERAKAQAKSEKKAEKSKYSAWSFRHFVLGAVAIFFYVGVEIGIPGELNFYISKAGEQGAGILVNGAAIGGAIASIYWLLMLIGRTLSSAISGKVSTRTQMITVSTTACVLIIIAIFIPKNVGMDVPNFIYDPVEKSKEVLKSVDMPESDIKAFIADPTNKELVKPYEKALFDEAKVRPESIANMLDVPKVPLSALFLVLCGLCTSVMWGGIFNLCVEGLGKYTEQASGIFMMLVVGGGVMPLLQDMVLMPAVGYMQSYWLVVAMVGYILFYALIGSKNVNTDIPVEIENPDGPDLRDSL